MSFEKESGKRLYFQMSSLFQIRKQKANYSIAKHPFKTP